MHFEGIPSICYWVSLGTVSKPLSDLAAGAGGVFLLPLPLFLVTFRSRLRASLLAPR